MFHRANKGAIKPQASKKRDQGKKSQPKAGNNNKAILGGMNQTAVKQYAKPQEEVSRQVPSANQNATAPYAVKRINTNQETVNFKEAKQMNNPQKQNNSSDNNQSTQSTPAQPQARVDIPGNNFQRPGAAAAQGNRPAYPGASYPGAQNQGTSYTAQANDADNGRKLVIGQGITMSGEIEACDHLIVEGTIEASLKGANVLDVAESGSYFGTVEIEEANIAGRFEGDITVRGRLTIEATGTIIGSVSYKELSMEAGATLDGSVSPIGSQNATKNTKKSAPSKSKKVSQNSGAELPFSDRAAAE
jgi:cytoskeletal protein CcmA (bactofilin family)